MQVLYGTEIDMNLPDMELYKLSMFLTEKNCQRVDLFHKKEDKLRTIYGELLARYIVYRLTSIRPENIIIKRDEKNKPYFPDIPLYFNISHSGRYVICAVSDEPIGVDIEEITDININMIKNIFTEEEYHFLMNKSESERKQDFFSLWTIKESYVKMLGMGMYMPFNCFSVFMDTGIIKGEKKAFFRQYEVAGYKCALCSEKNIFPESVCFISGAEIIKQFFSD